MVTQKWTTRDAGHTSRLFLVCLLTDANFEFDVFSGPYCRRVIANIFKRVDVHEYVGTIIIVYVSNETVAIDVVEPADSPDEPRSKIELIKERRITDRDRGWVAAEPEAAILKQKWAILDTFHMFSSPMFPGMAVGYIE